VKEEMDSFINEIADRVKREYPNPSEEDICLWVKTNHAEIISRITRIAMDKLKS
jgi:hypothetical protein